MNDEIFLTTGEGSWPHI